MEGELLRGEEIKEEKDSPRRTPPSKKEIAQNIFNKGEKRVTTSFVIFFLKNAVGSSSYAIYAGKKLGGAVERNKVKRVFREAIRFRSDILKGYDCIIIPRKESKNLSSRQIAGLLNESFFQLDLKKI